MKKKIKFLIFFLLIIVLVIIVGIVIMRNSDKNNKIQVGSTNENSIVLQGDDDVLVVDMGKKQEETETEPKTEPVKDPATITNEIYSLNSEIGTLYIPKTNLTTQIYCFQTLELMEQMPCFIYATGELNKPGIVFITGHNKRNGTLFSNNKKLEEGDEFYFKDYTGVELKYTIYSKFITNSEDTSFLNFETDKPVMVLSCCTDADNNDRIIVLGRAD